MQIRPVIKSIYATNEVETLAKNVLREIDSLEPKQPVISLLSQSLESAYETLQDARGNSKHNTQTQLMADADDVRDLAFRAFYNFIEAGSIRQNEPHQIASQAIMEHLDKFDRRIPFYGYTKESTELFRLFEEMKKVEDHLAAVGGIAWLDELKEAEDKFLDIQKYKLDEEIEKQVLIPTKEAKEQALTQLIAIVQTLNGLELAKMEGIADLNATIDQVIAEIEIPAKARNSRRSNDVEAAPLI